MAATNEGTGIVKAFEGLAKAIGKMNQEGIPLLTHKIEKWIGKNDPEKVADYCVRLFNNNEYDDHGFADPFVGYTRPASKEAVDAIPAARMAISYLKENGWKCKLANDYKGLGKQIVLIAPDQSHWYHSRYQWEGGDTK